MNYCLKEGREKKRHITRDGDITEGTSLQKNALLAMFLAVIFVLFREDVIFFSMDCV